MALSSSSPAESATPSAVGHVFGRCSLMLARMRPTCRLVVAHQFRWRLGGKCSLQRKSLYSRRSTRNGAHQTVSTAPFPPAPPSSQIVSFLPQWSLFRMSRPATPLQRSLETLQLHSQLESRWRFILPHLPRVRPPQQLPRSLVPSVLFRYAAHASSFRTQDRRARKSRTLIPSWQIS